MKKTVAGSVTFLSLLVLFPSCEEVDSTSSIATDGFVLQSGMYQVKTVVRFSDCDTEINEEWHAHLTNANRHITIVDPNQPEYPVLGRLDGSTFTAGLNDAGGNICFRGELIADNELAGELEGTSEDGKRSVEGSFSIIMENRDS